MSPNALIHIWPFKCLKARILIWAHQTSMELEFISAQARKPFNLANSNLFQVIFLIQFCYNFFQAMAP